MEIAYTTSKDEQPAIARSVSRAVWRRKSQKKAKRLFQLLNIVLWIPVGVYFAFVFDKYGSNAGEMAIYGVALVLCIQWIYRKTLEKYLYSLAADPGPYVGPRTLTADTNGITVSGGGATSTIGWTSVYEITEFGNYVLIFIDARFAHYVPKRNLEDVPGFIAKLNSLKDANVQ